MLNSTKEMLDGLEKLLRHGTLTVARKVEALTMVCFTETHPNGVVYHQWPYEQLPLHIGEAFKNKKRGDKIGNFKIVAVYDAWPMHDGPRDIA